MKTYSLLIAFALLSLNLFAQNMTHPNSTIEPLNEFYATTAPMIQSVRTNSPVCVGEDVSIQVSSNNTTSYQWQFFSQRGWTDLIDDNIIYFGTTTSTLHFLDAGMIDDQTEYRCIVTGSGGNRDTSSNILIRVHDAPNISVFATQDLFCLGSSSTIYSNSTSNIYNYQWYLNNQPALNGNNSNFVATEAGNYKLIVTDFNGCKNEISKTLFTEVCNTTPNSANLMEAMDQPIDAVEHSLQLEPVKKGKSVVSKIVNK